MAEYKLDEFEFLAEFQTRAALEVDPEVGLSGILVGTRATLGSEVRAVLAREAQLEAVRFLAQPKVDQRAHRLTGRAGTVGPAGRKSGSDRSRCL
jgi:hypothetical protein